MRNHRFFQQQDQLYHPRRDEVLIKHGELKDDLIIKEEEEEEEIKEEEDTKINKFLEICQNLVKDVE